ncbi:hypothetical protein L1856_23690 [Streptomyces sp. Tue 6430]|nr:hypothetical protein [Streptomyces sp. Tue 6430]
MSSRRAPVTVRVAPRARSASCRSAPRASRAAVSARSARTRRGAGRGWGPYSASAAASSRAERGESPSRASRVAAPSTIAEVTVSAQWSASARRRVPASSAKAGSGPDSAAVTCASSIPSAAVNRGGGVPMDVATRLASYNSRARTVSPSSTAIWARSMSTNARAAVGPA